MRTIPVMNSLAAEIRELCPNALLLNYVNPMSAVCLSLANSGVKVVGLCHGVQTTLDLLSRYTGVEKSEIDYICAGINHMGWFIKLESHGKDLYPKLREVFEKPEYYANEKVRGEMFRHFGYFMTESQATCPNTFPISAEPGNAGYLLRRTSFRRRIRSRVLLEPKGFTEIR